ncbi:MAG TPA: crossover junction endodeoxyribonuclease RuvC [Syntrophorhabdales bacterium]|nr:crossover junction endodeoxyribonuclease RuvC [Syntrophorhabdales bacterium]
MARDQRLTGRVLPDMIILGLDPGLASTGFGAIFCGEKSASLRAAGRIETLPRDPLAKRLGQVFEDINSLLVKLQPQLVAIENVFSLVRYPKAGILLGEVLGIIYLSAHQRGLPILEITPREVKNALVGSGSATKEQIKTATQRILGIRDLTSLHAADAIAVALTAYYRKGYAEFA